MRRIRRGKSSQVPQKIRDALGSERLIGDFFRFYMLILISESPKTGYEIMNEISKRLGKKVSPSIVYPFLRSLEKKKLIVPHTFKTGDRERNVNSLTLAGKALCARLFKQFTTLVAEAIEPSMTKCAHCGCLVYKNAYYEKIRGQRLPFCCRYCAASFRRMRTPSSKR